MVVACWDTERGAQGGSAPWTILSALADGAWPASRFLLSAFRFPLPAFFDPRSLLVATPCPPTLAAHAAGRGSWGLRHAVGPCPRRAAARPDPVPADDRLPAGG